MLLCVLSCIAGNLNSHQIFFHEARDLTYSCKMKIKTPHCKLHDRYVAKPRYFNDTSTLIRGAVFVPCAFVEDCSYVWRSVGQLHAAHIETSAKGRNTRRQYEWMMKRFIVFATCRRRCIAIYIPGSECNTRKVLQARSFSRYWRLQQVPVFVPMQTHLFHGSNDKNLLSS